MAVNLNISITGSQEKVLNKISSHEGLTSEEYGRNIILNFLRSKVIGYYRKKFEELTIQEMMNIFGGI